MHLDPWDLGLSFVFGCAIIRIAPHDKEIFVHNGGWSFMER